MVGIIDGVELLDPGVVLVNRWPPGAAAAQAADGTGRTNRQTGTVLGLSEKTVESHMTRLLAKSGCRSRVGLVVAANRRYGQAFGRPAA
ncbi:helix-turn-helix domain-containing protein [Saccharopolyspora hirsuta]|uniref:helix-turn-helix domain-containing protein n=1 Tax=Saccharopolyspora hirsuta TaxID=1837 RepID=UPI001FE81D70|nr:helix-turn-helix transcriptional regulator [Saccharopolyspora hirsuta]